MKHYSYNWEFIKQWISENQGKKGKVAAAMGTYTSTLDRWLKSRKNPIKLECIISFCNEFDVDISNFFLEDGKEIKLNIEKNVRKCNKTVNENNLESLKLEYEERIGKLKSELVEEIRNSRAREDAIREQLERRIKELETQNERLINVIAAKSKDGQYRDIPSWSDITGVAESDVRHHGGKK